MPPRKKSSSKNDLGFECGLSIPKFLQPYQDMLGDNSVFKDQVRKQREVAWEKQQILDFNEKEEVKNETIEKSTDTTHMSEKEKEKKDRILSNKNNDLVRELANKIVAGDKKETTEKKQNKIINVGAKLQKKSISNDKPKTAVKTSAPLKKTKGMLTFEQESDSD